ncbi:hypothetical protein N0Y54_37210 [Nostoc punctiforme UO1]|uniref:hypothetical protein n=1 Tax=Nostoc punctiforme TaxID=272131 RepID=UPI00309B8E33
MTNINIQQFQGISEVGDFQSALNDAINQALEALSVDTSDQRIAWRLIEVSGSKGGLLGEQSINVNIEAQPN